MKYCETNDELRAIIVREILVSGFQFCLDKYITNYRSSPLQVGLLTGELHRILGQYMTDYHNKINEIPEN